MYKRNLLNACEGSLTIYNWSIRISWDALRQGAWRRKSMLVCLCKSKCGRKIYQPFNKNGYKWSNRHDRSVISLWTKVPLQGDRICICSSLKDALCLWANTGIPALAVQGEGYGISDTAINELKRRYNKVYICFDNDEAGLKDGINLSNKTGFINVVLPPFKGGKDISDLYKVLSNKEKFKQLILKLFV